MSAQPIGLLHRLRSAFNILFAIRAGEGCNPVNDISFHKRLLEVAETHFHDCLPLSTLRVLDFGCGQIAPQTALFHADGHNVVGVDMEVSTYKMNPVTFVRVLRTNGLERALKSLVRHVLFDAKYFRKMQQLYGCPIALDDLDVQVTDGKLLPFDDHEFDFVVSSCVFEHVADVPSVMRELARVIKPSGLIYLAFHLFPSLSGGHNLEWHIADDEQRTRQVPPWDHLRQCLFPPNTFLNRLKLEDYRRAFAQTFTIVREEVTTAGAWALSLQLEQELLSKGYTREDLLSELAFFTLTLPHAHQPTTLMTA
jgi:SAM-dependent methyltransferase